MTHTVTVSTGFHAGDVATVEMKQPWSNVQDWYVSWSKLNVTYKDDTKEEIDIEGDFCGADSIDWNNPDSIKIFADEDFNQLLASEDYSAPEGNTWQPIETAPKDETQILTAGSEIEIAYWQEFTDTGKAKGWRDGWFNLSGYYIHPTHWMPLPEPPTKEEQSA